MTDPLRAAVLAAWAGAAVLAVCVLPGWRLAERLAGRARRTMATPLLAIALSVAFVTVAGSVLLALGRFSAAWLGLVALAAAIAGLPPFGRWLLARRRELPSALWLLVAGLPWLWYLAQPGYPPADRLQWYYADLGAALDRSGGIPTGVAEFGRLLGWLPDYVVFDLVGQAYRGLMPAVPLAEAVSAFRVPVALLGLGLVGLVLRLWLARPAAVVGTGAIGASVFFLLKFNAFKPEAFGIVLGLAAVWLVARGVRHERRSWLLAAGGLLGLDLAVHPIAAAVLGLAAIGVAVGALLERRRGRLPAFAWLVRAAALGVAVSVAIGVALQGRLQVATEALRPARVGASDPTWTFFLRSTGDFRLPEPAQPRLPLAAGVTTPWEHVNVASGTGWWILATIALGGLLLVLFGGRRLRAGVVGLAVAGALVAIAIVGFALAFHTYVPRWTGLVRFGQYVPLFVAGGLALAADGARLAWSRIVPRATPRPAWAVAAVMAALAVCGAGLAHDQSDAPAIRPAGMAALDALRQAAAPGDVVVSNALTSGQVEFFTGLEAPLEARQPLIEEPDVLAAANELLLRAHEAFADGRPAELAALGARWLLVVDDPATLGGFGSLGGGVATMAAAPGVRVAWRAPGVALLEVAGAPSPGPVRDDLAPLPIAPRVALAGVALALFAALAASTAEDRAAVRRRFSRLRRRAGGPPAA